MTCAPNPKCDCLTYSTAKVDDPFTWLAPDGIKITIPFIATIHTCAKCGQNWTDEEGRKDEAVVAWLYSRLEMATGALQKIKENNWPYTGNSDLTAPHAELAEKTLANMYDMIEFKD